MVYEIKHLQVVYAGTDRGGRVDLRGRRVPFRKCANGTLLPLTGQNRFATMAID